MQSPIKRIIGIVVVLCIATFAWMTLGGLMTERTFGQSSKLRGTVVELWGSSQTQQAPELTFTWVTKREVQKTVKEDGKTRIVEEIVYDTHHKAVSPNSSDIVADVSLDQRLKGLMWYSLYNLQFAGTYEYQHTDRAGTLDIHFRFPDTQGLYDGFEFVIDGQNRARELRPRDGQVSFELPIETGQKVNFKLAYRTRGMDDWSYSPSLDVANLENFHLTLTTDFADIDFPNYTISPSTKTLEGNHWTLDWDFEQLVTGRGMGVTMPELIQPGELASQLSFSAPISLMFFFLLIFVLGTLRSIDIHPINYLFIAAAFFAFHLLFAYSVDHIRIIPAFALSSVVSVILVVSYLRLVVSARFAFVEAAAAQMVYLIGFSLAHFWDGFTGLTVTVLSILTLFLLMQLTGRITWSEVLSAKQKEVALP